MRCCGAMRQAGRSNPRNKTALVNQVLSTYSRDVIFWAEKLNRDLLRLAYQTGGMVATNEGCHDDLKTHLGRYRPERWLKRLDHIAKPWDRTPA